jgi:homopolymeric O-antigen transport system ATP-binding protein
MQFAIKVENISKSYRIGAKQEVRYHTLRETIMKAAAVPWRRFIDRVGRGNGNGNGCTANTNRADLDFWALKDVSFEVQPGEVVGILGRNGAGKSTLLKILSRITEPTSGRCLFRGRIGSLLEVGTGFHQELTGRENIYLNGSILGMSSREIARRFDEIVDFAEITEFLDTPVKRYSSGMYVRLAFAVAAHLEPEILLVDEVLAVGDLRFQNKCLGKMREVGRTGRTVLFVSHNIAALESLCGRCILIEHGRVQAQGDTRSILTQYCEDNEEDGAGFRDLTEHRGRTPSSEPIMSQVTLSDGERSPISGIRTGSSLSIRVDFDCKGSPIQPVLGAVIKTDLGAPLFGVDNRFIPGFEFDTVKSRSTITCHLEDLPLMPGTYLIDLYFGNESRDLDVIQDAIAFEVLPTDVFGSGRLPPRGSGPIVWPASWELHSGPKTHAEPNGRVEFARPLAMQENA